MTNNTESFRDFEQAGWSKKNVCQTYHDCFENLTTQSVEALLNAVNVSSASTLLDVACGAGYVAGAAAELSANVTGVDFSPSMLNMAKQSYPTVTFQEADADNLPFENQSFSAVVNNFGKPHFPNPQAVINEVFRVLKSDGRYAFTAWDVPQKTIAFGAIYGALQALGNMDVDLPEGPNFFMFSDPEKCKQFLTQAGFVSPIVEYVPMVLRVPDADMVFDGIAGGTVRVAAVLAAQKPDVANQIKEAVCAKVSEYAVGDHYEIPMPALIAYAMKP